MINVDVIILSLTSNRSLYDMTILALETLKGSESDVQFNVTLVESNKDWDDMTYPYSHLANRIVVPDEEFNYNRFCNIGLQYGNSEWVVLCNNDLWFHKDWFSCIDRAHKRYPHLQSFCPWNSYGQWHERIMKTSEDIIEGYRTSAEMSGWCIVARREIFDVVKLNERVNFWYSDNVYADELQKHHIKHALIRKSKVDHLCSRTSVTLSPMEQEYITYGQEVAYRAFK